jgi:hypothetical protein
MFTHRLFHLLIVVTLLVITACSPQVVATSTVALLPPTALSTETTLPAASAALTPTTTVALTVTTTLDGLTTLPQRISWIAEPTIPENQVSKVEFLIDGQLAFVEQHAPYTYGRDGNSLLTSFLTPGEHSFTVRVVAVGGQTAESTVKAAVEVASVPPDGLANTSWTRAVTKEDVKKATSSEPPPSGKWGLKIDSVGWALNCCSDPGSFPLDVAYQSGGNVEFRQTLYEPPYVGSNIFCEDPDPSFLWSYTISNDGKTLSLHPVGHDPCGDRTAIFEGTWNRDGN